MTYKGESLLKKAAQKSINAFGYKLVRLRSYEKNQIAPQPRAQKVFCIGFNKTGTTTIEAVLRNCGLRMPRQIDQERLLRPLLRNQRFDLLQAFVADYDAFQDLPFSQNRTYIVCDTLFPGSKFILTQRDPAKWADSFISYYTREFQLDKIGTMSEDALRNTNLYLETGYVFDLLRNLLLDTAGGAPQVRWNKVLDRDFLVDVYMRRNAEIMAYFADRPDDLCLIDVSREEDTGRLLTFLGITDVPAQAFPRLNAMA